MYTYNLFHIQDPWLTCCGFSSLHWQLSLVSFSHSLALRQPPHSSRALQLQVPLQTLGNGQEEATLRIQWLGTYHDYVIVMPTKSSKKYISLKKCEYGISEGKANGQLQLEETQISVGSEMLMTTTTKITTHTMEIQHSKCKMLFGWRWF